MSDRRDRETAIRRARARVQELRTFYIHTVVFVCVNVLLFGLDLSDGELEWAFWPLLGWGVGWLVHAVVTYRGFGVGFLGRDWEERKVRELLDKDEREGD